MKIELDSIDRNSFNVREDNIAGNTVFLVSPKEFHCEWSKYNLHFRSLILDKDGNVLSRGFNKFFNATEKPELYPNPDNFNDIVFEEKTDGSLLICDWIFGQFNARTRGTITYHDLDNAADFEFVFNKYPKIAEVCRANPNDTYLFEITSPNQRIVLRYGDEPDVKFLGFIHKPTGLYCPAYSKEGKIIQNIIGCKSPEIYELKGNLLEIAEQVKLWEKKEGVVIKYNDSQNFVKAKAIWYNFRHLLKSKLDSLENLIDLFLDLNYPSYNDFFTNIEKTVDFETADECRGKISNIIDSYKEVKLIKIGMQKFIDERVKSLPSRKLQAETILKAYGNTNRGAYVFQLLDGKDWNKEKEKKLLWQILKK